VDGHTPTGRVIQLRGLNLDRLEPGGRTALHQHPVPVYVYVLEGTLTVQAQGAEAREYKPGQAFLEDVNHWHQAFNRGGAPVKILVVFVGERVSRPRLPPSKAHPANRGPCATGRFPIGTPGTQSLTASASGQ
jgi:hypothetical protein